MNAWFRPSGPLRGRLRVAGDKSISHRAAILAAMSSGPVRIGNFLDAADTRSTLDALRALGAKVETHLDDVVIRGRGLRGVRAPGMAIDVGNAGTLMRLLPGWLAIQRGQSFTLDGDDSIRRRPIDRIAEPLGRMGATIEAREGRFAPFTVRGAELRGIEYELPVASAQVKSCVLLAGLTTDSTTVIEPVPSRDHTERLLLRAGATVRRAGLPRRRESGCGPGEASGGDWREAASDRIGTTVGNAGALNLGRVDVPGDLSSAAFLIAAGVLVTGSRLRLEEVGVNWTRAGFLRIIKRMEADVLGELEPVGGFGPLEPVADLDVRSGPIGATTVGAHEVPLAIDELPLVALLGCFAEGETVIRGAAELRVKESDRIATVVAGLRGLGADIEEHVDGLTVRGTGGLRGGRLHALGDHRLALLGAVAGLASREGVQVVGMQAAEISYPGFADALSRLVA